MHFDERAYAQLFFPVPRKWQEHAQAPCYFVVHAQTVVDTYGMDEDLAKYVGAPWSTAQAAFGSRAVAIQRGDMQKIEQACSQGDSASVKQSSLETWEKLRDTLGRKALGIRPEHFLVRSRGVRALSKRRPLSIAFKFKEFPDHATWILFREGQIQACQEVGLVSKQDREWTKIVHEFAGMPTWSIELSWELWQQLMAALKPWKKIYHYYRKGDLAVLPKSRAIGLRLLWWAMVG